jgi:hypothetical protein
VKVIVKVINFLVAKPLNKCLLKVFLQELSALLSEFAFHANGDWLSASKALSWVWELFEEINRIISSNSHYHSFPRLSEVDFKIMLAFMVYLSVSQ